MVDDLTNSDAAANSIEALLDKAFQSGPAMAANELIHDVRQTLLAEYARASNYEVSFLDRTWEEVRATEGPRFRRFLTDMGFRSPPYSPVFVSLFSSEMVHFIGAQDFLRALRSDRDEGALLPVPVKK